MNDAVSKFSGLTIVLNESNAIVVLCHNSYIVQLHLVMQ